MGGLFLNVSPQRSRNVHSVARLARRPRSIRSRSSNSLIVRSGVSAISFVLIDTTWTAVRPQSRKIWLVSRLHALIWLNVAYGKYWVTHSAAYLAMEAWAAEARRMLRAFLARLHTRRTAKNSTLER